MLKQGQCITTVGISTGLPSLLSGAPTVNPPDTLAHYLSPDGSILEVIYREWERGKFTAFLHQTWKDGSVYHGDYDHFPVSDFFNTHA